MEPKHLRFQNNFYSALVPPHPPAHEAFGFQKQKGGILKTCMYIFTAFIYIKNFTVLVENQATRDPLTPSQLVLWPAQEAVRLCPRR